MQKNILAASVLMALGSQAHAATWVTEYAATEFKAVVHSQQAMEGFAATEAGVIAPSAALNLGAEYAQNDLIKFTLSSAVRNNYAWPTSFKSIKTGTSAVDAFEVSTAGTTASTTIVLRTEDNAVGSGGAVAAFTGGGAGDAGKIVAGDIVTCSSDTSVKMRVLSVATTTLTLTKQAGVICAQDNEVNVAKKAQVTFGLVSSDSTSATYRVSAIDTVASGTTTVGSVVVTPDIQLLSTGLTTTGSTIAFSAKTGAGTVMDSSGTASTGKIIAKSVDNMAITVSKFDAIVDVEGSNLNFVGQTAAASADIVAMAIPASAVVDGESFTNTGGALTSSTAKAALVTVTNAAVHEVTYSACFNFLDTTAATAGIQGLTTTGSATGMVVAEKAATSGCTLTGTDATPILRAGDSGKIGIVNSVVTTVIPTGTFSGSTKLTWTNAAATPVALKTKTITHADLGQWKLNGASVTVYGVPMGSTVDRMIWVTNKGATAAAMTASVQLGGTTTANLDLGTVAGNTTSSVDEMLDTKLAAAGVTVPANSRAMVTLTAPIKAADMVVSASYKVTSANDRLGLETSDTIDDVVVVTTSSATVGTGDAIYGVDTTTSSVTSK